MPFTIAHSVAVLPLIKPLGKLAIPAALVIGSMSPDFTYFLPFPVSRLESHSLLGIFWFCLPVSLVSYVLFCSLFAPLIHSVSPDALSSRLSSFWGAGKFPKILSFSVVASIVVGAITHIIWDSFTHPHGFSVQMLPVLETPVALIGGYTLYGYKILQHGSTLIGMSILLWLSIMWFRSTKPSGKYSVLSARTRMLILSFILIPSVIVGVLSGVGQVDKTTGYVIQFRAFLEGAIFSGGSQFAVGFTVMAFVVMFMKKLNHKQ
jgi:hypothetical protein